VYPRSSEFTAHVSLYDRDKEVGFLHSLGMANDAGDSRDVERQLLTDWDNLLDGRVGS